MRNFTQSDVKIAQKKGFFVDFEEKSDSIKF